MIEFRFSDCSGGRNVIQIDAMMVVVARHAGA
jgi:hypothetical protein